MTDYAQKETPRFFNKPMLIMLFGCALLFGLIFGFKAIGSYFMNQFFDAMPMPPATITAAQAKPQSWPRTLNAVGNVRAVNGTSLTNETAGIVTEINFRSGDLVSAGTVLLRLDDDTDRAELESLRAAAALARQDLERTERLQRQGSVSESELDRARSQHDQARAQYRAQQARVEQKSLRAPFDGELGIRQVDLGQYLTPGTAIVNLQQLDPVFINFSLPEQRLAVVRTELDVQASVDAWPNERFTGRITALEPGINPATRNFQLQASFENTERKLRPGMFARVMIDLGERDEVLAIPQTAVSFNPYGNAVYVISERQTDDGETQSIVNRRFVRTGQRRGDMIAVLEGLEPGDRVATSGLLKLGNDRVVRITEEGEPGTELSPQPDNS